jgi:hypothetical protein
MTHQIGDDAYSKYKDYPKWPYEAITYLMNNNELIWKLIKYTDADAWEKPNLTLDQKRALVYNGKGDMTNFRVFMDKGQSSVFTQEISYIKISNYELKPITRTTGKIAIMMEVYCHYMTNQLSNYTSRYDAIAGQFMEVFNGANLGLGLGRLFFDWAGDSSDILKDSGSIPFKGKFVIFSNNIGG